MSLTYNFCNICFNFLILNFFKLLLYDRHSVLYLVFYLIYISHFSYVEHSHVNTNLVYRPYWMQNIGSLPTESFKNLWTPD